MFLKLQMIVPLRHIYNEFRALKDTVDSRLNITGNVMYLEKALKLLISKVYIDTALSDSDAEISVESELGKGTLITVQF